MKSFTTHFVSKTAVARLLGLVLFVALAYEGGVFNLLGVSAAPANFFEETVVTGLNLPTDFEYAPDGRIFVAEKSGVVRVSKNGALLPTPFITLTDINDFGDRGLISIELDPNFSSNGYVYLAYTYENDASFYEGPKTARLVRVTADGDVADPSSMVVLLGSIGGSPTTPSCEDFATTADCIGSDSSSHTIADVEFGPDGYMYVSTGDGANFDGVDPRALRALDLDSLNGKVLRLNADGTAVASNPFYNGDATANRSKVWNYGLRNPLRLAFHPATGDLVIGDVGWFTWEELNLGEAGNNFGWPCQEGTGQTPGYGCTAPGYTEPLLAYPHDSVGAGSVTAGVFYTGSQYPEEYRASGNGAWLFYGDYAQNWIRMIHMHDDGGGMVAHDVTTFEPNPTVPVAFNTDAAGNVCYSAIFTEPTFVGEIRCFIYDTSNHDPVVEVSADPMSGGLPLSVAFTVTATDQDGDPLSYSWDFGDGSPASTEQNPTHEYSTTGPYTATVTVTDGVGGETQESITVYPGNDAPVVTITSPANGTNYTVGQSITVNGGATDTEDGTLTGSSLRWRVILHHNSHIHIEKTGTGSSINITGPDHDDTSVFIEVELTATDSEGLATSESISLYLEGTTPDYEILGTVSDPNPTVIGTPISIMSSIQNVGGVGDANVLLVVHDDTGTNYYEEVREVQLTTLERMDLEIEWTPTEAGTFFYDIGIFSADWSTTYAYGWHAEDLIVEDGGTPPEGIEVLLQSSTVTQPSDLIGTPVAISAVAENVGGPGLGHAIISISDDGGEVFADVFDFSLAAGETVTLDTEWTPTTAGTYFVDYGFFSNDWATMYEWNWHADRFVVVASSTGTSTAPFTPALDTLVVQPTPYVTDQPSTIMATIGNDGATGSGFAMTVVSNEAGEEILSNTRAITVLANGQLELATPFTPTEAGTYFVDLGLFSSDWGTMFEWNWHAFTMVVSNGAGTTTPPTGTSSDPFLPTLTSASLVNGPAEVDSPLTMEGLVENSGAAGNAFALFAVTDASGVEVFAEATPVALAALSEAAPTRTWTPTTPGTYYLDIGLFSEDWGTMYEWNWHALPITVTDGEGGTGTTTPPTGTSTDPFLPVVSSSSVAPNPAAVGELTTFSVTLDNDGEAGTTQALVVISDDGGDVFEAAYPVAITNGGSVVVETDWTPTTPGTYYYDIGLFNEDWSLMFDWYWHELEVVVEDESTPPAGDEVTIVSYSIFCDDESYLPNWGVWHSGAGGDDILTESDINAFLTANSGNCTPQAGWSFEYGLNFPYPESTLIGPSGNGVVYGTTDASGRVETSFAVSGTRQIWNRVVRQEGYLGFSGKTDNFPYTAEFYCHRDLWHYDNNEIIDASNGNTYYCVSFNAPEITDPNPAEEEVSITTASGNTGPETIEVSESSATNGVEALVFDLTVTGDEPVNVIVVPITIETTGGSYNDLIAGVELEIGGETYLGSPIGGGGGTVTEFEFELQNDPLEVNSGQTLTGVVTIDLRSATAYGDGATVEVNYLGSNHDELHVVRESFGRLDASQYTGEAFGGTKTLSLPGAAAATGTTTEEVLEA